MKYLDAKRAGAPENKMAPGSRSDQRDPSPLSPPANPLIPKVRPEVQTLADELGVDLSTVKGTGAGGTVLIRDVRAAAADLS